MNRLTALIAATLAVLPVASPAQQQRPDEQNEARRDLRAGNVRSLRDIERRVLPTKPGTLKEGEVVKLSEFLVSTSREMDAAAIAIH